MSGWFPIKFNNTFVFPDPEPPIIDILYGRLGIYGNFYIMFSFIFINVVIKIDHLHIAASAF